MSIFGDIGFKYNLIEGGKVRSFASKMNWINACFVHFNGLQPFDHLFLLGNFVKLDPSIRFTVQTDCPGMYKSCRQLSIPNQLWSETYSWRDYKRIKLHSVWKIPIKRFQTWKRWLQVININSSIRTTFLPLVGWIQYRHVIDFVKIFGKSTIITWEILKSTRTFCLL